LYLNNKRSVFGAALLVCGLLLGSWGFLLWGLT
jgi:hypothetical protein